MTELTQKAETGNDMLYLECGSGISGDMMVAALLDLGADRNVLAAALNSLPVPGFQIAINRVLKSGLDACDFAVILDKHHENHDHDMAYLHGNSPADKHAHEDSHSDKSHNHEHAHRGLADILDIIEQARITSAAKETAVGIFQILAAAEAKAHGVAPEHVHFHEVGAVDSIVDIVAAAVCLDNLGIRQVIVPELQEGKGFVRCQHGMIPVPVPAVANIAAAHGLHLHIMDVEGEFVTPTGAAIVAAIKTSDTLPRRFTIRQVGIGAGKRTYEKPSILRAMVIQEQEDTALKDWIVKIESNIDDCTGEALGFVMEQLLAAGARDVFYMPIYMKKNRPAYQLNVICDEEQTKQLEQLIFRHTTTIGIRKMKMERQTLPRESRQFRSSLGEAVVKICHLPGTKRVCPEYESVKRLCMENQISFQEAYRRIEEEGRILL